MTIDEKIKLNKSYAKTCRKTLCLEKIIERNINNQNNDSEKIKKLIELQKRISELMLDISCPRSKEINCTMADIESWNDRYKYLRNETYKLLLPNKVLKGAVSTVLISTVALTSCTAELNDNIDDNGYAYLLENGYEDLVPYYMDGSLKNVGCADYYLKYQEKYDLDMEVVISVVDEIIYSYVEQKQVATDEELDEAIDNAFKSLEISKI